MTKLVLIGNCQVDGLRHHLGAMLPDLDIQAYEVWKMSASDIEEAGRTLASAQMVVAQPLHAPQYGPLKADALRSFGQQFRLEFIHNLHFEGAMPDCCYVGRLGSRLTSPVSNYHSRIVLQAFLDGLDEAACLMRLQGGFGTNAKAVWSAQISELRRRESQGLIPFADEIDALTRQQRTFHLINHPNGSLLAAYAHKVAQTLMDGAPVKPLTDFVDTLAPGGGWATYSWASEELGLPYVQEHFIVPGAVGRQMSPREFVDGSYEIYRLHSREDLVL